MALTFYYGSGSPYAWRVWLALEHKGIPYEQRTLSFAAGDLQTPEYRAINPRGKVPAIVDDGYRLYESAAIVEYLDATYPERGQPLFPTSARDRATVRRLICEADNYFTVGLNRLTKEVLFTKRADWSAERITSACDEVLAELEHWVHALDGDCLAGALSAADYTLYPMIALALRCEHRKPDLALASRLPPRIGAWMRRIEALPHLGKTWPPHWK